MKTRIYSCGKSMTSKQLVDMTNKRVNGPEFEVIDLWFPELCFVNGKDIPLTQHEILWLLPDLIEKTIVTISEQVILMMLREVRKGRMAASDLELWCGDRQIEIAANGDMIDYWDGGFFEIGFHLRFS